jgi:hypothetical protein
VDGLNGFRCYSLRDMIRAIHLSELVDRNRMMTFAVNNFSIDSVRPKYLRAFSDFESVLERDGWLDKLESTSCVPLGLDYRALYV